VIFGLGFFAAPVRFLRRSRRARSGAPRLEELDGVPRWILDEDLTPARSLDDLTTKRHALSSQPLNGRIEIASDDLEPIPPSRLRNPTGFARTTGARLVEQQSQVILRQTGESRGKGKVDVKAETIAVEVDRLVDIVDEVPHRRLCHVRSLRSFACVSAGGLLSMDTGCLVRNEAVVGLDVGTSAVKAVAAGIDWRVVARREIGYRLDAPRPGWAEQDPEDWWRAAQAALAAVSNGVNVVRIGLSGLMHRLVALDGADRVTRPAILWNDQRTSTGQRDQRPRPDPAPASTRNGAALAAASVAVDARFSCS
jgi:FGGY family of carbohydrate kinases, N-terminal domain